MPKLAIYVPKKDMREIERWRKRINFSQVFMKALSQEIRDRSRMVEAPEEKVAAAADYYKRKLAEGSASLVDVGYSLGAGHVVECQLAPETIRGLLEIEELDSLTTGDLTAIEAAIGKDKKTVADLLQEQGYSDESHPMWRVAFYQGYVRGVTEAWKQVCEQMISPSL
jgi:hypothetical protein